METYEYRVIETYGVLSSAVERTLGYLSRDGYRMKAVLPDGRVVMERDITPHVDLGPN